MSSCEYENDIGCFLSICSRTMDYYHIIYGACISSLLCVLILLFSLENESALPIYPQKINADNYDNNNGNETRTTNLSTYTPHLPTLANVFKEAENSVVQITSQPNESTHIIGQNGFIGQTPTFGSGIVYDLQGHIITNNHVIEGAKRIDVRFANGDTFAANVIGVDPFTDLAVLQITHYNNSSNERLYPLKLGNSSLLQVGQEVAAIGNPFGVQNLMTEGIIGGLGLLLPSNQSGFLIPEVIVTDVPLNPGNSGGPLLNMNGEVIGINTAVTSSNQFSKLSYSIGSNIIKKITPQLIAYGRYNHPWLGVTGFTTGPIPVHGAGPQMNYKGVSISSIQPGSPAAKAKLRPITDKDIGDIVLAIEGHAVNRFEDIINYIESDKSVGDTIVLKLLRNGTTLQNVNIKLAKMPNLTPVNAEEEHNKKITMIPPTLSTLAMRNWTNVVRLSNSSMPSQGPRLAASQNNVYAVWEESYRSSNNRIMFTKNVNRGNTFSTPINLTSGIKIDSETPDISAFGNNVYVVWADNSTGNFDIFLVKSENRGDTFSKPINLSNDPGVSYFPRIASDGNNSIYIVWTDNSLGSYNILFTKSVDNNGTIYSRPTILTGNNTKGASNFPSIAVSRNNSVYVVWSHKNNTDFDPSNTTNQTQTYDVFFTRSIDRGNTFSKPINLSNDPSNSQSAAISISRNNSVYVVWADNFIGTYEVFFTKSLDGGNTFDKVMVISSNVARALSPSISTYGNNAYAVWNDNTSGKPEIFFTRSIDSGSTFNMPININNDTGISDLAQITPDDDGELYLVWQDNIAGNSMIYFTKTNLPTGSNSSIDGFNSGRP